MRKGTELAGFVLGGVAAILAGRLLLYTGIQSSADASTVVFQAFVFASWLVTTGGLAIVAYLAGRRREPLVLVAGFAGAVATLAILQVVGL